MSHNNEIGKIGEEIAEEYLKKKGYKIIERNVKTSFQELDIIAKIKEKLVFIEVKTRTSRAFGDAEDSVAGKKIKNLKKAISRYLHINSLRPKDIGLDLIVIYLENGRNNPNITHYEDII